jgi:hypothetical protein
MPLPPKGDPQRPLRLAVRSTRILGILFVAIGLLGMLPIFFLRGGRGAGAGGGLSLALMSVVAMTTILIYVAPGALYLVCAVFIGRRRTWAVITAMVLAGIQLAFLMLGLVSLLVMFLSAAPGARSMTALIPLGIGALVLVALAQLEYHLSKCFEAIRHAPVDEQRGFEPLPAAPVVPTAVVPTPIVPTAVVQPALSAEVDDVPPAAR